MLKPLKKIWPNVCLFCKTNHIANMACPACLADLPWLLHACKTCAQPLTTSDLSCGQCLQKTPPFEQTVALFHYQAPINALVSAFKLQEKIQYAALFSILLQEKFSLFYKDSDSVPDCIIPMPLHQSRTRQRGFNQALEIAKCLSKSIKIPINKTACKRIRATQSQRGLDSKARKTNLRDAFHIDGNFDGQHVVVLDDVITTGSTVHSLCHALKKHGIKRIDVWCVARTSVHVT